MSIESERDLEGMRRAGGVVAEALRELRAAVAPGVTPVELDRICGAVFTRNRAVSAPRRFYGAPVNAFVSVNEAVVHGLPRRRPLQPGDVVKLDVTPWVDGYVADAAVTVVVPPAPASATRLLECVEAAFAAAMAVTRAGTPVNAIGSAVEAEVRRRGFRVIRELTGHGVGRHIHEPPEIPNHFSRTARGRLTRGLVVAVEPMVAAGLGRVVVEPDGWTIRTRDRSLSAHFEHTVLVTEDEPVILTA